MWMVRLSWLLLVAPVVWAGEYAVLTNGFRLRAERHTVDGDKTTLYDRDGGYSVIPTELIAGFEAEEAAAREPAPAPQPAAPLSPLEEAARQNGIDPALVASLIAAESGNNPAAVSPKGAQGLMQLMPATAREMGVTNAFDPTDNVRGGTAYLRRMLDRYQGQPNRLERALAAYNAGPKPVDRYGGLPPYRETVDFVSRVIAQWLRSSARP